MFSIEFTEEDKKQIAYERYHHPHPHIMRKMEVLYLKSLGYPNGEICTIAGITGNTMLSYFRQYNEGGVEKIKEVNFYRPQSKVFEYKGSIESYLTEHPPVSISQASALIYELTGKKIGETQTRHFLKNELGFRFRKVGSIPAKAMEDSKKKSKEHFWSKS
jgi:transposase